MSRHKFTNESDELAADIFRRLINSSLACPLSAYSFVFDKIARSIRHERNQEKTAIEFSLFRGSAGDVYKWPFSQPNTSARSLIISSAYACYSKLIRKLFGRKIIYAPCITSYTKPFYKTLKKVVNSNLIFEGCVKSVNSLRIKQILSKEISQVEPVMKTITNLFNNNNLSITNFDREYLQQQLLSQAPYLDLCERDLLSWRPDLLLLAGCLYPPHVEYLSKAREHKIKTVMIQHGLDCEPFILDFIPFDVVAVWGAHREQRYRSAGQNLKIAITGNPRYDHLRQASQIYSGGEYLLYTTRPHLPHRCTMPSRWFDEGFEILKALITSFPNLPIVIKPHPGDFIEEYRNLIKDLNAEDRVQLSNEQLALLFPDSIVVISEDSTAVAEAMIAGRPVVLAQFSGKKPTLPVVEYEAAQIAHDTESLREHIKKSMKLNPAELTSLHKNQSQFLSYVVGPLDGKSLMRLGNFLDLIVNEI